MLVAFNLCNSSRHGVPPPVKGTHTPAIPGKPALGPTGFIMAGRECCHMDVPTLVADALGDEAVAAHVPLKGEDALFVTRTRTLHYRSEGLLSDESVDEYPHDAERVEVGQGRRKATITLDYGTDGQGSFGVPTNRLDEALHPVLAGVLNAAGVTQPGETVKRTYRFSELTLVVTSERLVKHIGSAVWDEEYEEVPYEDVTGLDIEEGNVSSQIVLHTAERTERIKAPNEGFREVDESVRDALFTYYDVDSLEAFKELMAAEAEGEEQAVQSGGETADVSFDEGIDPIGSSGNESGSAVTAGSAASETDDPLTQSGFTSATEKVVSIDREGLREELDALEAAIKDQQAALEAQRERIRAIRELIPDQ